MGSRHVGEVVRDEHRQVFESDVFYHHERYAPEGGQYDVGLLFLDGDVTFDDYVRPAVIARGSGDMQKGWKCRMGRGVADPGSFAGRRRNASLFQVVPRTR